MTNKQIVLLTLYAHGPLADEEGQGLSGMEGNSWRPARVKLVAEGLVVRTPIAVVVKSGMKAWCYCVSEGARKTMATFNL